MNNFNLENIHIIGSFSSEEKLTNESKTFEYKKIENEYILKTCIHICIIGLIVLLNILNHLLIFYPRLSYLNASILIILFTIINFINIRFDLLNKLNLLNSFYTKIEEIQLDKNCLKIKYKLNNKTITVKLNSINQVYQINRTNYELNLLTNTLYIPYQKINNNINCKLSNDIHITKKTIKKDILKKGFIIYITFLILMFLVIKRIDFLLLIMYPISLIFIFIIILLIQNKYDYLNLKTLNNIINLKLINYENKTFICVDEKNNVNFFYLNNYNEILNNEDIINNCIEINTLKRIININKK